MKESIKRAIQKYHKSQKGKAARARAVKKYQTENENGIASVRNAIKKYLSTERGKASIRNMVQRYNARKHGLKATLTANEWEKIKVAFGDKCAYCGCEASLCQEHFIPVSRGGAYVYENILPSCKSCNHKKKDKHPADWLPSEKYQAILRYFSTLQPCSN